MGKSFFVALAVFGLGYGFSRYRTGSKSVISSKGKRTETDLDVELKKQVKLDVSVDTEYEDIIDAMEYIKRFDSILQVRFKKSEWDLSDSLTDDYGEAYDSASDKNSLEPLYDFWVIDNQLITGEDFVSTFVALQKFNTTEENWVYLGYDSNSLQFGGDDYPVKIGPLKFADRNGRLVLSEMGQKAQFSLVMKNLKEGGVTVVLESGEGWDFPKNVLEFVKVALREYGIPFKNYSDAVKEK